VSTRSSGTGPAHRDTVPPDSELHAVPQPVAGTATGALAPSLARLTTEHVDPDIYDEVNVTLLAADVLRGRREGP
jgi:hypothetical protein